MSKLRGLTANDASGVWRLTDLSDAKLENIRPGVIVTIIEHPLGVVLWSTAEAVEQKLDDRSLDLVLTSPPYSLTRPKEYDDGLTEAEHVKWLTERAAAWLPKIKPTGSLMLNLGDVWVPGEPTMSLWQERVLLNLVDRLGYKLVQKIYWENAAKMPQPAEWVTVRRIRLNHSVENIWWLSPTSMPKAHNDQVLVPYSASMRRTLSNGTNAGTRPSGHVVSEKAFQADNGGSIPHNLLIASNTASNTPYLRRCREAGIEPHPARFPAALPEFAIKLTTDEGDLVFDPFGGSLQTAETCVALNRRFITCDRSRHYLDGGVLRPLLSIQPQSQACAG